MAGFCKLLFFKKKYGRSKQPAAGKTMDGGVEETLSA